MKYIILIFLSLALNGCDYQHQLNLNLESARYLNPDHHQQSKPVVLSIYQLTQPFPFRKIQYHDIHADPSNKLADSLIDYQELEIAPRQTKSLTLNLPSSCKYIGIVAGYHKLTDTNWKHIIAIPKTHQKLRLTIFLGTSTVTANIEEHLL